MCVALDQRVELGYARYLGLAELRVEALIRHWHWQLRGG
jgi:hypothetical protein